MQTKQKLFRDPIHNVIHFDAKKLPGNLLLELIDTQTFQRLRNIKQMGLANFVYHGAEHSRFAHSVGTMHVANRFYNAAAKNNFNEEDNIILLTAALLHDLGHAPFSHAFEAALKDICNFKHEELSVKLITSPYAELQPIISKYNPEWPQLIADTIVPSTIRPRWFHSIVASQCDADRMDYLLRDGYMTGVKNYHYDLDRIIEMLDSDESGPLIHYRAIQAVESYILSRYHMYLQVYHHKTVRSAEKLIESIFRRAAENFLSGDKQILNVGRLGKFLQDLVMKNDLDLDNYSKLLDAHAWTAIDAWTQSKDPIISELAQRLLSRNFLKSVELKTETLPLFNQAKQEIENAFIKQNIDPKYFFGLDTTINKAFAPYKPKHPTLPFSSSDSHLTSKNTDNIRILMPNGKIFSIEQASQIVKMLTQISSHTVRCFFPKEMRSITTKILANHHLIDP